MACQRNPAARSEPAEGGRGTRAALLFGYFLLGKQEKVTRAQGCAWKAQGRGSVVARNAAERKSEELDPAYAGMTK